MCVYMYVQMCVCLYGGVCMDVYMRKQLLWRVCLYVCVNCCGVEEEIVSMDLLVFVEFKVHYFW